MAEASDGKTFRAIGKLTDHNSETVRRYMQGQAPSVEFVTTFCDALGLNYEWLLTGQGPMKHAQVRTHALQQANPTELLTAVAGSLETVGTRLERLEIFVQTLEARIRTELAAMSSAGKAKRKPTQGSARDDTQKTADGPDQRARIVARAVTSRPRPDAR